MTIGFDDKMPEEICEPEEQSNGNTLYFYKSYLVKGSYFNKKTGYFVSMYKPCSICWYFDKPNDFTITHWKLLEQFYILNLI